MARLRPVALAAVALAVAGSLTGQDAAPSPADTIAREAGVIEAQREHWSGQASKAVAAVKPLAVASAVAASAVPARPGSASPGGPALAGDEDGEDDGDTAPEPPKVSVTLTGPPAVAAGDFVIVGIAQASAGAELTWQFTPDPGETHRAIFAEPGTGRLLLVFIQPSPAKYRITLLGQVVTPEKDPVAVASHEVTVGGTPPKPDVDPDDDDPDPDVDPTPDDKAPFPADGLHVLIVYESEKMTGLTPDQREIIQGAGTRAALDAAAPGRYRIYDQNADLTYVPQVWKDAMAVQRDSLPWLAISNGRTGYSGPLDMTAAEFRALLTEFK